MYQFHHIGVQSPNLAALLQFPVLYISYPFVQSPFSATNVPCRPQFSQGSSLSGNPARTYHVLLSLHCVHIVLSSMFLIPPVRLCSVFSSVFWIAGNASKTVTRMPQGRLLIQSCFTFLIPVHAIMVRFEFVACSVWFFLFDFINVSAIGAVFASVTGFYHVAFLPTFSPINHHNLPATAAIPITLTMKQASTIKVSVLRMVMHPCR